MKKIIITAVVSILISTIAILVILELNAQKDQLRADKIEVVASKILDESRKLLVHLPKNYTANREPGYPLLIALDGTSHDQDVAHAANILSYAKLFPELIIIGIPNTNRNRDLTPAYIMKEEEPTELGEGDQFLSFLEKEAIPFIQKKYNTNDYRMISGHSRAGLFSLYAFLERPSLFDAYFCYSPAFWRNDKLIVNKAKEFLAKKTPSNKYIYLSLGDKENEKMKAGFDAMNHLLDEYQTDSLYVHHNYTAAAIHGNNAYFSIPFALKNWEQYMKETHVNLKH